jgi:hypothetical protein
LIAAAYSRNRPSLTARFAPRGRGTDAIQALLNALQMVGTEIYCSEEHRSGKLSWDDNWSGYGFPVPGNIRDLLAGSDKKYL